jgi:hypothetical protein
MFYKFEDGGEHRLGCTVGEVISKMRGRPDFEWEREPSTFSKP